MNEMRDRTLGAGGAALSRRAAMAGMAAGFCVSQLGTRAGAVTPVGLEDGIVQAIAALDVDRTKPLKVLLPAGSGASLGSVTRAFEARTGVRIDLVEVPVDNINTRLLMDKMLGGESVDVALPATFALPDLVTAEVIRPLDGYRQRYEPEGFRDGILYNVGDSFEDRTYGFQTDGDAYVMFYHAQMLTDPAFQARYADQFGMSLGIPLTWEELDRQTAFFHAPDEGRFGGLMVRTPPRAAWEFWIRLHAKGVWPLAPDMTPQFAGPEGIAALEEMMRASAHQVPEAWQPGLTESWDRFARGDVFCTIGWGGTYKYVNQPGSQVKGKLVFGPTPGGIVGGELLLTPYFNWGWNYVVTTASARPELAYLFCLFAATPDMSTLAVRETGSFFDPFRPEHYRDSGILEAYSNPFLDVQRQSLERAIPDFYLRGQSEYFRVLGEGLLEALTGEVSPDMALKHVVQLWELITSRSGRDTQSARWAELRAKYPAEAQRILRDAV